MFLAVQLYLINVMFKNRRRARYGAELVVHAKSKPAAESHVKSKYAGCTIDRTIPLESAKPKHFVIADLVE
jgi:hypothetical protein